MTDLHFRLTPYGQKVSVMIDGAGRPITLHAEQIVICGSETRRGDLCLGAAKLHPGRQGCA